jgi:hypothetical protein
LKKVKQAHETKKRNSVNSKKSTAQIGSFKAATADRKEKILI